MPSFDTWSQENLAKFAAEAYKKMQQQNDQIQQLQNDLKDAMKAYRELLK
jgi:conjugal transfer/entry exclusion protein